MNKQELKRLVSNNFDELDDSMFDDALKETEAFIDANLDMPFLYVERKSVVGTVPDGSGGYTESDEVNLDEFVVSAEFSGLISVWILETGNKPRFLSLTNDFANSLTANSRDIPEYITPSGGTSDGDWLKYRLIPGLQEGGRIVEGLAIQYKAQKDIPPLVEEGDTNFLLKKFPDIYKFGILEILYRNEIDPPNTDVSHTGLMNHVAIYNSWVARFSRVVGQVRRGSSRLNTISRRRLGYV